MSSAKPMRRRVTSKLLAVISSETLLLFLLNILAHALHTGQRSPQRVTKPTLPQHKRVKAKIHTEWLVPSQKSNNKPWPPPPTTHAPPLLDAESHTTQHRKRMWHSISFGLVCVSQGFSYYYRVEHHSPPAPLQTPLEYYAELEHITLNHFFLPLCFSATVHSFFDFSLFRRILDSFQPLPRCSLPGYMRR